MTDASRDDRIADVLLRWEEEREKGNDLPIDQLCAECPELRDEVEQKVEALKRMSWMSENDREAPLPDMIANRYKVERLIGEGGHGRVVLAFDQELERQVAIKIPHDPSVSLFDEARKVAKLRHDNIVTVHDVAVADGQSYVVSDYIEGGNLADLIADGPLGIQQSVTFVAAIADGLQHAHEQGFVHRDIKPANILISKIGKPYLADFGISVSGKEIADDLGTIAYMSPEQVAHEKQLIGPKSDIYSLGIVLYECLTGKLPYQAETPLMARESVLFRNHLPPSIWNGEVPKWLNKVCLQCLSKHPEGRYESAKALAEALRSPKSDPVLIPVWVKQSVLFFAGITLGILACLGTMKFLPLAKIEAPLVSEVDDALVFDGWSRIVTPLERRAPVTLEAWVRPDRFEQRCQFIIGSDIPGEFGIGLGLCPNCISAEYIAGDVFKSSTPVPLREWSHIAAVFAETETRLYFNGELIATAPATEAHGGTNFVIGNVGEDNHIDFFIGKMRGIRVSSGERYLERFDPAENLVADESTLLLYDGMTGVESGDQVTDLSGHKNDGRWHRFQP